MKSVCDEAICSLITTKAIEVEQGGNVMDTGNLEVSKNCVVYNDSVLSVSLLGKAAIKGTLIFTFFTYVKNANPKLQIMCAHFKHRFSFCIFNYTIYF